MFYSFENLSLASSLLQSLMLTRENDICIGMLNTLRTLLQMSTHDQLLSYHTQVLSMFNNDNSYDFILILSLDYISTLCEFMFSNVFIWSYV